MPNSKYQTMVTFNPNKKKRVNRIFTEEDSPITKAEISLEEEKAPALD